METFKDIINYENLYQISNLGAVKNIKTNRILKHKKHSKGYLCVCLFKNKKPKTFKIHRLIAIHFIINLNNYPMVNHIDNIRTNNNINNLEWINARGNTSHGYNLKNTTSKYTGVSFYKRLNKWQSRIYINNKLKHIGYYLTEELASKAYNKYILKYNITNKYSKNT
jgi:hypothetical protein